jgi:hypothetical protein
MNRVQISIVTPSYNQADFLEQTILSVIEQEGRGSFFDLEYFVIDGGSTDHSIEILRQYAGELTGWCSEPDRGQTHAINKGLEKCRGDIIAYINSDDYYLPGAFKRVAETYRQQPDSDLIHGVCHKVDAKGELVALQISSIKNLSQMLDLWDVWLRRFDNQNFIQPEVFWTRRLASKLGAFNESLYYPMDYDYWLRAFDANAKVITVQEPLAAFRIHGAQKTSQQSQSMLELIEATRPFLERDDDERIRPSDRWRMIALNALHRTMIELGDCSPLQAMRALASLGVAHPCLMNTSHYWRYIRRSLKGLFRIT